MRRSALRKMTCTYNFQTWCWRSHLHESELGLLVCWRPCRKGMAYLKRRVLGSQYWFRSLAPSAWRWRTPLLEERKNCEVGSFQPACYNTLYLVIADWGLRLECCRLLCVTARLDFVKRSGLYFVDRNDRERIIAIAKTENLVLCFESFFADCKYNSAKHPFWYPQFDVHGGWFIFLSPASLMEKASILGVVKLLISYIFDPVLSFWPSGRAASFTADIRLSISYCILAIILRLGMLLTFSPREQQSSEAGGC